MSRPSQMDLSQTRTLLIHENLDLVCPLVAGFERAGMPCHHVTDTAAGLQAFHQHKPHLVLLSLSLPHLGSVTLCPQIRAISTVPIVVLSVRTRKEDHLHALNLGADDFIVTHPLDEQLTIARLLTLLRRVYLYRAPCQGLHDEPLNLPTAPSASMQRPIDWATCEACGYMGPQCRFEQRDSRGEAASVCPHCRHKERVRFLIA